MLKSQKSNSKGFTIIEVMIVLAIAGLILLIVFLAVPALQRNSRNTQRKSEAAALSAAYSEYVNNHGGAAPGSAANVYNNAKLSFYTPGNVSYTSLTSSSTSDPTAPDTDHVVIVQNATCDATKTYATSQSTSSVTYSSRGGVIVYTTEGGTTNTTTCISTQ